MEHQDGVKRWAEIMNRLALPENGKTLPRSAVAALATYIQHKSH